jgi:hypothetical protein
MPETGLGLVHKYANGIVVDYVDQDGKRGMVGILMPGKHYLGRADYAMGITVSRGVLSDIDGRVVDESSTLSMSFAEGHELRLTVDPKQDPPDHRYPVVFRAHER